MEKVDDKDGRTVVTRCELCAHGDKFKYARLLGSSTTYLSTVTPFRAKTFQFPASAL